MANHNNQRESSSFRDPSGFIFFHNGEIFRQVNLEYQDDYVLLHSSDLYSRLIRKRKLVAHQEVDSPIPDPNRAYKIIKPEKIKFISYPYEWSFSQLKDAALLTLNIQIEALHSGMSLKDASVFNIQFQDGHPIFIDTLSFTKYDVDKPWIAYKQFCQHFLAPLALMSYCDIRLNDLLKVNIDGIPLDFVSKLLPKITWMNFGLLSHIHLHAIAQQKYTNENSSIKRSQSKMTKNSMIGIIENLEKTIKKLKWEPHGTNWLDYYKSTNYSDEAFQHKIKIIRELLVELRPKTLLDLGANNGVFSRQAKNLENCFILSTDIDPEAVEVNYQEVRQSREKNILPLVIDIINPSPGIGWNNCERESFLNRIDVDVVMALALIHHLAIANNIPLSEISKLLSRMGKNIIIEFVPKTDSQVKRLLATREDIFPNYTIEGFMNSIEDNFTIMDQLPINNSDRVLFLLKNKKM